MFDYAEIKINIYYKKKNVPRVFLFLFLVFYYSFVTG